MEINITQIKYQMLIKLKRKRLYYEIEELEILYRKITAKIENNEIYIELQHPLQPHLPKHCCFDLTQYYPFRPPILYICKAPFDVRFAQNSPFWTQYTAKYSHIPKIKNIIEVDIKIEKKMQIPENYWSPALHMEHYLFEIQKIEQTKNQIKYYLFLKTRLDHDMIINVISFIDSI